MKSIKSSTGKWKARIIAMRVLGRPLPEGAEIHHVDGDHGNTDLANLVGLCPNHHKMLHDFRYRKEIRSTLKEKGFSVPQDPRLDFVISQEELKKVKSPFEGL